MVPQSIELIELDVVDSSNTWLAARVRDLGLTTPTAVLAHQQTQGRGRAGREWAASPDGSLCLSVAMEVSNPVSPWFSIVVGVAVVRSLNALGVTGLQLKWPNDLLLKGRKLGGILCELVSVAHMQVQKQILIVGLGLNLKGIHQPQALGGLGSSNLLQDSNTPIDLSKAELAVRLATAIVDEVQQSQSLGFAAWQSEFNRLDAWFGQRVEVVQPDGTLFGKSCGCHSDGSYLIQKSGDLNSGLQCVQSGDLSLRKASDGHATNE
ncbi:MAG: biotin--[acetyl-CoA-carboxylase] ligase [Limnobacter sp.]|nr:biotin--[acetyl-CoA-carboxylase] ligase [Limnobacter sp.]